MRPRQRFYDFVKKKSKVPVPQRFFDKEEFNVDYWNGDEINHQIHPQLFKMDYEKVSKSFVDIMQFFDKEEFNVDSNWNTKIDHLSDMYEKKIQFIY